jgi:hypothetical protein
MGMFTIFAHAFGQRYELPIPLLLFVLGGAGIVLVSFLVVLPHKVAAAKVPQQSDGAVLGDKHKAIWAVLSLLVLAALIIIGITGSQEVPENILPTLFWLVGWIAIPLSCGVIGDWTKAVNPFAWAAKITDTPRLRSVLLGREKALAWPAKLGWWPAAVTYFVIACGELIYNQTATKPAVTATALLVYFVLSAFLGLIYGQEWLARGEVFSVLFSTWGRLGFWRFGAAGKKGFAGGLLVPFEASPSRTAFVLLLLVSVAFDGLLSTPLWSNWQHQLPHSLAVGTIGYQLFATVFFMGLAAAFWLVFGAFAAAVSKAGEHRTSPIAALAGLLPSLLPISFGYLLAHNIEYLLVNGQLLFPLIGNPTGKDSWPIHLAYLFNDNFEPHIHLLPSSFYWYFSVALIIAVHIIAVVLAHRHLGGATKDTLRARRSEYPWIVAMVCYTMLSLWLLAQPLVKEKAKTEGIAPIKPYAQTIASKSVSSIAYVSHQDTN